MSPGCFVSFLSSTESFHTIFHRGETVRFAHLDGLCGNSATATGLAVSGWFYIDELVLACEVVQHMVQTHQASDQPQFFQFSP